MTKPIEEADEVEVEDDADAEPEPEPDKKGPKTKKHSAAKQRIRVPAIDTEEEYLQLLRNKIAAKKRGESVDWSGIEDCDKYNAAGQIWTRMPPDMVVDIEKAEIASPDGHDQVLATKDNCGRVVYRTAPNWGAIHDYLATKVDPQGEGGVYNLSIRIATGYFTKCRLRLPPDPGRPERVKQQLAQTKQMRAAPPPPTASEPEPEPYADPEYRDAGYPPPRRAVDLPEGARWVHHTELTPDDRVFHNIPSPLGREYVAAIRLTAPAPAYEPPTFHPQVFPAQPQRQPEPEPVITSGGKLELPDGFALFPRSSVPQDWRVYERWPNCPRGFIVAQYEPRPVAAPVAAAVGAVGAPPAPPAPAAPVSPTTQKLEQLAGTIVEGAVNKVAAVIRGDGAEAAASTPETTSAPNPPAESRPSYLETPLWRSSVDAQGNKSKWYDDIPDNLDNIRDFFFGGLDKMRSIRKENIDTVREEAEALERWVGVQKTIQEMGLKPPTVTEAATTSSSTTSTANGGRTQTGGGGGDGVLGAFRRE